MPVFFYVDRFFHQRLRHPSPPTQNDHSAHQIHNTSAFITPAVHSSSGTTPPPATATLELTYNDGDHDPTTNPVVFSSFHIFSHPPPRRPSY